MTWQVYEHPAELSRVVILLFLRLYTQVRRFDKAFISFPPRNLDKWFETMLLSALYVFLYDVRPS